MDLRENQVMKKFNDMLGRFGTEYECDKRTYRPIEYGM